MPFVSTNNGELFITESPEKDSTPLILIHGASATHHDWDRLRENLSDSNVMALDLPGHGESGGDSRQSIRNYARDVISLLDALDIPRAIFGGHSMGGGITQTLALDYPERVAGIILMATGAKLSVHPLIIDRAKTEVKAVAELLDDWCWLPETAQDIMRATYDQILKHGSEILYNDYYACSQFDVRERLNEIGAPTLVMGATDDKMTRIQFSADLQEHIPHAQRVIIENAGHNFMIEKPAAVAEAIHNWMTELSQAENR
jgi:pimeloyl-ACP methyl ester carboxylesterase